MKTTLRSTAVLLAVCSLSAAAEPQLPADHQHAAAPATIGLDEIERGQKGWGLSVFAGTEPQRFEVEVLGVTRNSRPEMSYILARLSGHGLDKSGVFGGMSGSPVYLDGRLAGAVSYSYLFGIDAVAGITPIDAMRTVSGAWPEVPAGAEDGAQPDRFRGRPKGAPASEQPPGPPRPQAPAGTSGQAVVEWSELVRRDFRADLLEERLEQLLPRAAGAQTALQWSASGFGEASTALLSRAFGGLAPGGTMPAASSLGGLATAAGELAPGSSVAVVLIQGDLNVAGYGTVTARQGDEILAFGHPLFGLGPIRMPLAPAEVVTVIASRANSFKVSNVGPVVGAFDQDRAAGVHGRLGLEAPMIPVSVRLRGLAERQYRMRVADIPQLAPTMVALAAYGSLDAGSFSAGSQGLDLEARFRLAGHDDLVVRQSFDSTQAGIESILYLMGFSAFLKLNEMAEVDIEAVEVEFTQVDRPRTATLIAAHADRRLVEPGETVKLILELQAYRGERYHQTVETRVPADAPEGRFVLLVGDGTSMDGVRLTVERRTPQTFEQALELMQSFRPRKTLRVFGLVSQPGLAIAGEVLPQLPGSVRSIFAGGPPTGTALGLAIAFEQDEQVDRPISGYQRVDLEVRRR